MLRRTFLAGSTGFALAPFINLGRVRLSAGQQAVDIRGVLGGSFRRVVSPQPGEFSVAFSLKVTPYAGLSPG